VEEVLPSTTKVEEEQPIAPGAIFTNMESFAKLIWPEEIFE